MINKDMIKGKITEIIGEAQTKWGELSENELQQVKGNVTALVGILQQKLGVTKEEAQKKVDELVSKFSQEDLKSKAAETASKVLETTNVVLDAIKEKLKK